MQIMLNGESRQVEDPCSVLELVQSLEIKGRRYAVEINQQIVPKSMHQDTLLASMDCVEIVQAIGGG
ncbi:MAG: thiamine biosynthesis protein ThiS [Gammaproteobacteria bacterium]|nr:MAG: thiamine biosynthesis protein ThiS [Gammaproteobacteria bacterium]